EGLAVRYDPAFQALAPAGLEPADAVLSGPDGMDVEPEAQRLGSGEAVLAAQLRTAAELAVAVRPPTWPCCAPAPPALSGAPAAAADHRDRDRGRRPAAAPPR